MLDEALERHFARRAIGSGVVTGALAIVGLFVRRAATRLISIDGLLHAGLPLVILSGLCGVGVIALLAAGFVRGVRALAVGAVVAMLAAWGLGAVALPVADVAHGDRRPRAPLRRWSGCW